MRQSVCGDESVSGILVLQVDGPALKRYLQAKDLRQGFHIERE